MKTISTKFFWYQVGTKAKVLFLLVGVNALLALPQTTLAQSDDNNELVKVTSNPQVDFKQYKSYTFGTERVATNEGMKDLTSSMPGKKRVEDAIKKQMAARGLQTSTNPDLIVVILGGVKNKDQAAVASQDDKYKNWAPADWYSTSWNEWWADDTRSGTLVVDLLDNKTHTMIWRAYCTADITKSTSEAQINKAVAQAFTKFPPPPSK